MPRERMKPGEHGGITVSRAGNKYTAATYVRDSDGRRRRVARSSDKSAEDARRKLKRHLAERRAPLEGQLVTQRTTLSELFEIWIATKVKDGKGGKGKIQPQSAEDYRECWRLHGAGPLGALRVTELPTSWANKHLQSMTAPSQARRLRNILSGMFGLAVRYDVLSVNPMRETETVYTNPDPARAVTPAEFERIRAEVGRYALGLDEHGRRKPGPRPGKLLPAFVELMAATGGRPNEVLALRRCDINLLSDPPVATFRGTLKKEKGKPLTRQEFRKGNAPPHTVVLPEFGVKALADLLEGSDLLDPVFANRNGGWMSLNNMRTQLRNALPEDLDWVTPHSFRRTVATVIRDAHGPAEAQAQLSHSNLATTETYYLEKQTQGPDARAALERFAEGEESAS
jgi:integrase